MNKNVKRIVAIAMIIGTISAVAPVTNISFLTTKAYASTDNTDDTLSSLKLETSGGSSIKLYDDNDYSSSDKVDNDEVVKDTQYYAKTSSSTISISTSGVTSKYVRVFKGTSSSTKGKKTSSDISLSEGTNTIIVRIYNTEPDSSIRYDEDSDVIGEYKVKVKCTATTSDNDSDSDTTEDSDSYDEIYLDRLSVAGESITLSNSKTVYSYNVTSDTDEVSIKAVPEDEDEDTVTIDGTDVDDSDNFKRTVSLDKGNNKITVEVQNEDDDTDRVYTLNITRGGTTKTTDASNVNTNGTKQETTATIPVTVKTMQWVQVNGGWQYNDAQGNPIKGQWFYDRNLGKWYCFDANGMMMAGVWTLSNGKYYYLNPNGSMATNTMIGIYRVDSNGAWVR